MRKGDPCRPMGDLFRKARQDHICAICGGLIPKKWVYNSHMRDTPEGYKVTKMHKFCMRERGPEYRFDLVIDRMDYQTGELTKFKTTLPIDSKPDYEKIISQGLSLRIYTDKDKQKMARISLMDKDGTEILGRRVVIEKNIELYFCYMMKKHLGTNSIMAHRARRVHPRKSA